jgi:hypothetical protein
MPALIGMPAHVIGMLGVTPAMAEDPMMIAVQAPVAGNRPAHRPGRDRRLPREGHTDRRHRRRPRRRDPDPVTRHHRRPITLPISFKKAYTAVNFNADTSALGERADTPIGRLDFLVMSAGGAVVQVGGALVGGVGVSGAPSGETDEECAKAGIAAVQDDLEMAM